MARSPLACEGEHAPLSGVPETGRRERSRSPFGSAVKACEPCPGLAWGGEPESLDAGNLWPRKERANLRVPRGVRLRSPAHRMGRRPPPPGLGGGGVRPVAPASKPEPQRTSHNAAPYDPPRIVQGDEGIGVRIHQRLSVIGRTVEHPPPAGSLDGGSDQCSEAGSLVIAKRVAFDVLRVEFTASSRANVVFPLPAQPTTTTRSGIGRAGTGRAVMPVTVRREGQLVRGGHGDRRTWPAFS